MQRRKISILGDSISTYEGYNPYGYSVYYREDRIVDNGLAGVDDTWWMQVISFLKGELLVNNSFSGSTVAGEFFPAACSDRRCVSLGEGRETPDLILIEMGANDRGFEVPLGTEEEEDPTKFFGAYLLMLKKIKKNYPSAQIICATLPLGKLKEGLELGYDRFMRRDDRYDEAIKRAAEKESCLLADLAAYGEYYETLDYCHPTLEGHRTLASLWIRCLKNMCDMSS